MNQFIIPSCSSLLMIGALENALYDPEQPVNEMNQFIIPSCSSLLMIDALENALYDLEQPVK